MGWLRKTRQTLLLCLAAFLIGAVCCCVFRHYRAQCAEVEALCRSNADEDPVAEFAAARSESLLKALPFIYVLAVGGPALMIVIFIALAYRAAAERQAAAGGGRDVPVEVWRERVAREEKRRAQESG